MNVRPLGDVFGPRLEQNWPAEYEPGTSSRKTDRSHALPRGERVSTARNSNCRSAHDGSFFCDCESRCSTAEAYPPEAVLIDSDPTYRRFIERPIIAAAVTAACTSHHDTENEATTLAAARRWWPPRPVHCVTAPSSARTPGPGSSPRRRALRTRCCVAEPPPALDCRGLTSNTNVVDPLRPR